MLFLRVSEISFHAKSSTFVFETQPAAELDGGVERSVMFKIVLVYICFFVVGVTVKHRLDKRRQRGFAKTVILFYLVESFGKLVRKIPQLSETLDVQRKQSHNSSISSPLRALSAYRMTVFRISSSGISFSASLMNSAFKEGVPFNASISNLSLVLFLTLTSNK